MAGRWLDITDGKGTRREVLRAGVTRVGGGGSEISIDGVGHDQLQFWDDPPRVLFVGGGPPPACNDVSFEERALRPGDRIQWGGVTLEFGGDPAPTDLASVEEVSVERAGSEPMPQPTASGMSGQVVEMLRAGLVIDLGLADKKVVKRWQNTVIEGTYDPVACAESINASAREAAESSLLERSGRLLRDFLMASLLGGARGTARRVRHAAKSGTAFVLAQGFALLVFTLIVVLAMLFLRHRGTSFDEILDRMLLRN